jgi:uridine kinase
MKVRRNGLKCVLSEYLINSTMYWFVNLWPPSFSQTKLMMSEYTHEDYANVQSLGSLAAESEIMSLPGSPTERGRKSMDSTLSTPPGSKLKSITKSDESFHFLTPVSGSIRQAGPLVKKIEERPPSEIIVIGIAGGSGSGKTTLATAIYESIGEQNITFISHDSYYCDLSHLTEEQRAQQNFDHPDSLDTALLVEHVLALKRHEIISVPSYDYTTHSRVPGTTPVSPRPVVLIEGILIFSDKALYDLMDVKIFVDTDDDIRLIRRIQRDTVERGRSLTGIINQYMETVRPMHLQFVEPSKRNADIIVPVGLNSVALDLVVSKLKSHLAKV